MPHAEVNGQRIHFEDSGGDGPPVVLGHGFLMDLTMFDPQVEALTPAYRIVRWDARGFGDTEYDGQPFTYWDLAADLLGLLDHLGIDRAVVGGMSQGGFSALRAALLAPERVRGLVLLSTQAGVEDPAKVPLYQGLLDRWVADGPSDDVAAIVAGLIITDPTHDGRWIATWRARPKESLAQPGATLLSRDDLTERVGEIRAPALVVHGTEDQSIPLADAERLADLLPGSGPVVTVGGGHAANLTNPGPVNEAISRFLAGLPE